MTQTNDQSQQANAIAEKRQLKVGVFIAIMSENDDSTPFWIAQVISLPDERSSASQQIFVRWFQASGSASDPYDAKYTPSVRKLDKDGTVTYWETYILSSQVFHIFHCLTSEDHIDRMSAHEIKAIVYK